MKIIELLESFTVSTDPNSPEIEGSAQIRKDLKESLHEGLMYEGEQTGVLGVYSVDISRPGVKNKNKRLYTLETWNPVLARQDGENSLGLINHPKPNEAPDLHDAFGIWKNHRIEKNSEGKPVVRADLYILDNENGKLIESILNAGGNVELSTRGFGELKEAGVVTNYKYKSTDAVYEGSYGVRFNKEEQIKEKEKQVGLTLKETGNTDKNVDFIKDISRKNKALDGFFIKNESVLTNNKDNLTTQGDAMLTAHYIKRILKESKNPENAFEAYEELKDLKEAIKDNEEFSTFIEKIDEAIESFRTTLTESAGSAKDMGSAEEPSMRTPDNSSIKDTDENEPEDVKPIEVEDIKDTDDSDRGDKNKNMKAGSSKETINKEIGSGESPKSMKEETDEKEPKDVKDIEVEDIDDTTPDERTAYTDTKAGTGDDAETKEKVTDDIEKMENLQKLKKDELIEVISTLHSTITQLQEEYEHEHNLFNGLAEQYLKVEDFAMKAEELGMKVDEERIIAQEEVNELVETINAQTAELTEQRKRLDYFQEYAERLEEAMEEQMALEEAATEVPKFVQESIAANPHLSPYEKHLMKASNIEEAREMMSEFSHAKRTRVRHIMESTEPAKGGTIPKARKYLPEGMI